MLEIENNGNGMHDTSTLIMKLTVRPSAIYQGTSFPV